MRTLLKVYGQETSERVYTLGEAHRALQGLTARRSGRRAPCPLRSEVGRFRSAAGNSAVGNDGQSGSNGGRCTRHTPNSE
jgi:hypothetical protein